MKGRERFILGAAVFLLVSMAAGPRAFAVGIVQCPGDTDGDAIIDAPDPAYPNAKCKHMTGGDGFAVMGDGLVLYTFGFHDVTGLTPAAAANDGLLAQEWPGPTIVLDEGDQFYLSLTPVGMVMRPDLFDPHTVHFHGFPNASTVYDGEPMASLAVNQGATLTYYYNIVEPGTYMYHCHVEATEHMQMGMLANLYVRPAQNVYANGTALGSHVHSNPDYSTVPGVDNPTIGDKYAYNDGDGSTLYDVEAAIQLGGFDPVFHIEHVNVQPLPFAGIRDTYPMLNGRGYPDTVDPNPLPGPDENGNKESQVETSLVTATQGQKILLRLSSLETVDFYTITVLGIPMKVVGKDARLLRGPTGIDLSYETTSVTLGGGQSADVILDTADVPTGTYYLYSTNLHNLSNDNEDFGGMMTEIRIN